MTQNKFPQDEDTSLKGKRIVITAEELELAEHRGIASFAKALVQCFKEEGAEVWLLTQFHPNMWEGGLRWLPKQTREFIHTTRVLDALAEGASEPNYSILERRLSWARKTRKLYEKLKTILELFLTPILGEPQIRVINLQSQFDNLYLRKERLGYLENITGILCAKNIFKRSLWMSTIRNAKPIKLNLNGFEALFITSPQNITARGVNHVIQTIHDLIPLEEGHVATDHMVSFTRRLEVCERSKKIFVSRSTANKYHKYIYAKKDLTNQTASQIIVQPPSIKFPVWLINNERTSIDLEPCYRLLLPGGILEPFKYMLFNSSVDPRKNLVFLIKSYIESNLFSQGIKLCITGKLKNDNYSKSVRELVKNEPGIVITGYVSENEKTDLYLNALSILSPSLVEGFGIPILDAACMGIPCLASDSDSHIEIQSIKDFQHWIIILQTLETREWAVAMQAIAFQNRSLKRDISLERKNRVSRYLKINKEITSQFKSQIKSLVKSKTASKVFPD